MRFAAVSPAASGTGCAASTISMRSHGMAYPYRVTTTPDTGPGQWSSNAFAIAADALPAPTTIMRPLGAGGRCGGRQCSDCATLMAASNMRRNTMRAEDMTGSLARRQRLAGFCPISKFASVSSARTIAEWSHALPPCAAQALNSSWQVAVFGSETPSERPVDNARFKSF